MYNKEDRQKNFTLTLMSDLALQRKAVILTAKLSTPDLIQQAKIVQDANVLDWLLNELATRMSDSEFAKVCEEIDTDMI